jgi:acyl dehydratase
VSDPQLITNDAVTPGMELGEVVFGPLERVDFVKYAGASGDFNPIHTDEGYAKSTGAPAVFAMGMLPAGYLAHAVSDWFGGPHHLRRYKVRFTTRVWPGDEVVCTGRVREVEDGVIKVEVEAKRRGAQIEGIELDDEETAIVGEADVELPE